MEENDTYLAFKPEDHTIHDLSCFKDLMGRHWRFSGVKPAIEAQLREMESEFKERGWCFVRLPEDLCYNKTRELQRECRSFFRSPLEIKNAAAEKRNLGYSHVDHKEGIRLLTGGLVSPAAKFPEKLQGCLNELCYQCDALGMELIRHFASMFGYASGGDFAVHADLPVAYSQPASMIDIAHYFNAHAGEREPPPMGENTDEVNCVPHVDPGLLSISFFSSTEGLQMYDPKKKTWVAGPNSKIESQGDIGVLWLGTAAKVASDGKFQAGVHRVIYPKKNRTRTTMWFEICTVAQVNGPDDKPLPKGEYLLPHIRGAGALIQLKEEDNNKDSVLYRLERIRGVPFSKAPVLSDEFKAKYDPDIYSLDAMLKREREQSLALRKTKRSCNLM